jgi:hypothetical protein
MICNYELNKDNKTFKLTFEYPHYIIHGKIESNFIYLKEDIEYEDDDYYNLWKKEDINVFQNFADIIKSKDSPRDSDHYEILRLCYLNYHFGLRKYDNYIDSGSMSLTEKIDRKRISKFFYKLHSIIRTLL